MSAEPDDDDCTCGHKRFEHEPGNNACEIETDDGDYCPCIAFEADR